MYPYEFFVFTLHLRATASVITVSSWCTYQINTRKSKMVCKSPYSVRIQENTDQKKRVFGHFSHSDNFFSSKYSHIDFKTIHGVPIEVSEVF